MSANIVKKNYSIIMKNCTFLIFLILDWFCICKSDANHYKIYPTEELIHPPLEENTKYTSIGKQWICLILGVCSERIYQSDSNSNDLNIIHQWNQLEFDYPNSFERQRAIESGIFKLGVIAPIDVDIYYSPIFKNTQTFITIPRFIEGIPATLGTITEKTHEGNPVITPFPNWQWHHYPEKCLPERIISVFRVKIDECGRIWVLDTGKIGDNYVCPPQILAFDLSTNRILHQYEFPVEIVTFQHLLVTPMVDTRDPNSGCKDTFIYMADALGFALLVYDVKNRKSWRIQDKTFYPYPNYGTYTIADESFDLMDGILGLALSPLIPGKDRVLFYHAMSSPTENFVSTSFLRNYSIFQDDPAAAPHLFNTYKEFRDTQAAAQAIDQNGVMFFGLMQHSQIVCWNTADLYGNENFEVIASDSELLQFPSGIKIIRNKNNQEELWILTSRFQRLATGSLNPKEANFRILSAKVEDLIQGTKCKKTKKSHQNYSGGYGFYTGNA